MFRRVEIPRVRRRQSILLMDDGTTRQSIAQSLAGIANIVCASSFIEAVRHLDERTFDAVVVDEQLPGRGGAGRDLLRRVRQRQPKARRILMGGTELEIVDPPWHVFLRKPLAYGTIFIAVVDATAR